MQEETVPV